MLQVPPPAQLTRTLGAALALTACTALSGLADGPQFESPPVHPIEISEDGTRLFALHQADHRLIVWNLTQEPMACIAQIMV